MGIMGIYVRTSIEKEDTSIDQQKQIGIQFCKKNKFEYQIYEDVGKSGYKIDDDNNPFENRPGFKKLLQDIEDKIIDKVWVFEHSRLSRHEVSNRSIQRIFSKHNVILYENEKQFDLNNPQNIFFNSLLTSVSQYERSLIIDRTTRGVRDTINRGIRGYNELYGYKKGGKKEDGYMRWIPVESEIENIKYSYQKFLKGVSLKSIIEDIYKNKKVLTEKNRTTIKNKWARILSHFEYTGYSLNTDGLEILNKYKRFETDSIEELKDKKYYVKSKPFPVKIVSIQDWITVMGKLYDNKKVYKDKIRNVDTQMVTGIVVCPYCDLKWYFLIKNQNQSYYQHYSKSSCHQKPKSMKIEILDNIFSVFYFYFYLVFDDTKNLIEENQKIIKINVLEIREKINTVETENRKIDKQLENIQSICEETTDREFLKLTLMKENNLNVKKEKNIDTINKLKMELEELNTKYDEDELELTYYNVEKNIIDFFEKMSVSEKRTSLIRIIKNCQLFQNYLVIDTGNLLFIFNIQDKCFLPDDIYDKFKKDKKFKDNFLDSSLVINKDGKLSKNVFKYLDTLPEEKTNKFIEILENISKPEKIKKLIDKDNLFLLSTIVNYFDTRVMGDIFINEIYLKRKTSKIDIKTSTKKRLSNFGIDYDISDIDKIITFTKI
jgi:DNA invertase Pin-like site-specific DNA recombinase